MDLCAHRCADVQDLVQRLARAEGTSVEVVRLSAGLTPTYVPLVVVLHPCAHGCHESTSPLAAAEEHDPAPTTTPDPRRRA